MASDDDFVSPNSYRTQHRSNSTMSQMVTSSSANRPQPPHQAGRNPGTSQPRQNQVSQDVRLSQLQEGMAFLLDSLQEITGSQLEHRAIKRPAEQKPFDKKPNTKEECQICKKLYANKTTLFRHYRAIHKEMNPEKYHGCSLNNTVVSLDASLSDTECPICGYIAANQTALARHNRTMHSNVVNDNVNKENINNNAVGNVKDEMYKCEDCACYYEERSKFDEHMKVQHGFEVVCKICNKNFVFKDIDKHVKDSHPDVYNKKDNKNEDEKKEKVIVKKVMRNRKGKRVHVFACTKCDNKFYDNAEAQRHSRTHKKGLKIRVAMNKCKSDELIDLTSADDNVIFTCEACDVSTGSYDAAVEHSQNHITNMSNNIQLVTQTCPICDLKFEPLCYKMHMDLHYKNKEIHRESFKYFKYRFQLLLGVDWENTFDMNDAVIKNMISRSIYSNIRSVKMMKVIQGLLHEGQSTLYKCCQCDNFVDPAAVAHHALNYDTCVRVKSSHACDICKRTFNNRLTRDKHAKDHNSGDSFKIALFNNESDIEFNKILNDPRILNYVAMNTANAEHSSDNINDNVKVVYKCLCGLCFVRKESADVHTKICPGKDPKKSCPKCNNLFDTEELLAHCFEHHLNETRIVIENFTPDVIEIESDEESENGNDNVEGQENGNNIVPEPENGNDNVKDQDNFNNSVIEIDSSDDDDQEQQASTTTEIVKSEVENSNIDEIVKQESHNITGGEAFDGNNKQNGAPVHILATERDINMENEDHDHLQELFGEVNNDDSQDTITTAFTDSGATNSATSTSKEIKCVPTNLLLNPFNFENRFLNRVEIVRQQIETTQNVHTELINNVAIKEEKPWWFDPTDYSKICRRRSLRQIEMPSTSCEQVILESLLTDDEEEMESSAKLQTNANNIVSPVIEQNSNAGEMINELLERNNHIARNEDVNVTEKAIGNNNVTVENEENIQCEMIENNIDKDLADAHTNKDGNENNINQSFTNTNLQNYEYSDDDDLFLPSGKENTNSLKNSDHDHVNDTHKEKQIEDVEQIREQNLITKEIGVEELENTTKENISAGRTETRNIMQRNIAEMELESSSVCLDTIEGQVVDKENDSTSTERDVIQSNDDDDMLDYEEINTRNTLTENDVSVKDTMELKLASNENISKKPTGPSDMTYTIKKELELMNIKVKTELIAQTSQNTEMDCDNDDLLEVKTEPNDRLEIGYNKDSHVVDNIDTVYDSNCCVC